MSIAGIIDAMRSNHAPAVRIVWQCLENHVNAGRVWSTTDHVIATELKFSVDTVSRSLSILEAGGIMTVVRHKRRPTTFRMLRVYPDGCPRPRRVPELSPPKSEPTPCPMSGLALVSDESMPELSPEKPETLNPPVKNPPGRESEMVGETQIEPMEKHGEEKAGARSPERPLERCPTDADQPPPEKMLGNGKPDEGRRTKPTIRAAIDANWRPGEAGIDLALRKGAIDLEREIERFIRRHQRDGTVTDAAGWKRWWEGWCDKIPIYSQVESPAVSMSETLFASSGLASKWAARAEVGL